MPDQRGFGASDRPRTSTTIATDKIVDDIFALADALGLEQFALVGHDLGGAVGVDGGAHGDPGIKRLTIVNAPHPVISRRA